MKPVLHKIECFLFGHVISMNQYFIITGQIPSVYQTRILCLNCGKDSTFNASLKNAPKESNSSKALKIHKDGE